MKNFLYFTTHLYGSMCTLYESELYSYIKCMFTVKTTTQRIDLTSLTWLIELALNKVQDKMKTAIKAVQRAIVHQYKSEYLFLPFMSYSIYVTKGLM